MAKPANRQDLNGMIISDTAIRQPVFITMLMLLAIVIGLLSYRSLPVNLLPDFEIPIVAVTVPYPGAGPQSVADQVTSPLEDTINTINGVRHITSTSSEGIAQIVVEFENEVDVDQAEQDVRERVNAQLPQLPRDIRDPSFFKFDPNDQAILTLAIASEGTGSSLELRRLVDDEIVPRLQRVQGVGAIDVTGGEVRQINVQMDLEKLKTYGILPAQITRAIDQANSNYGLGKVEASDREIGLRAPSMLQQPADIARVQITGTRYRVGDVATIEDGVAEVESYARLDGKDAITLGIRKQSGTNTVAVADEVKAEIAAIFAGRPELTYFIPNDQSTIVQESVDSALEELLIASVAAMLVVLLFFRDLRNTLVTVAGLPVIMIGTFVALQLFGLSINLMTLLALSLSVGLVIDDAIVVRENVFRHMERGEAPRIASSRGTAQVSLSVLAMTLTIIAVFLPVTFTSGVTGIIFKSFGITVAAAMAISLVEAFTLAPMLSAYFFKQRPQHAAHAAPPTDDRSDDHDELEEANEDPGAMGRFYSRVLHWSLRTPLNRLGVVAIAIVVLMLSGLVASSLKFNFLPSQDQHQFLAGFEMPPGTPLQQTDQTARQAEQVLLEDPAVEAVQVTVGSPGNPERADFFIRLHEDEVTLDVQQRLRETLSFLPGLAFAQPSFGPTSAEVSNRPLQISVQTTRPVEQLIPLLQEFQGQTANIPGLVDIDTTYRPGKPELRFLVDPTKTGDLGVTNDDLATSVRALINGERATVYRDNSGNDIDVVVRLQPGDRATIDDVRGISVPTPSGNIPLSSLAQVELGASPTVIRRYDRMNQIIIGANVVGRNLLEVQSEIARQVQGNNLPSDIIVTFTGDVSQQTEGFETLFIAMGLSVLFVYMVLASQFGSFLQPLVIMLAMPFSFIGAFLALRIANMELDIMGMIGLIMLLGLVTKNSILLVDFTNRLRRAGLDRHTALERAGAVRLRPILMTTLALVAGSIPIAIGIGEGTEFRRGLSVVLIGGLLTSMLLTLLVVPVAYSLLESVTSRFSRLFRRKPALVGASGTADHSHGHSHSASDERPAPVPPVVDAPPMTDPG